LVVRSGRFLPFSRRSVENQTKAVSLTLITDNAHQASVAERPVALPPKKGSAMYSNPPQCEKCGKAMHHVATMPVVGTVGKNTILFHCTPCEQVKWIEN